MLWRLVCVCAKFDFQNIADIGIHMDACFMIGSFIGTMSNKRWKQQLEKEGIKRKKQILKQQRDETSERKNQHKHTLLKRKNFTKSHFRVFAILKIEFIWIFPRSNRKKRNIPSFHPIAGAFRFSVTTNLCQFDQIKREKTTESKTKLNN